MSGAEPTRTALPLVLAGLLGGVIVAVLGSVLLVTLLSVLAPPGGDCASAQMSGSGPVALGPPGSGALVGATEYGGPGDPSSGVVGAAGINLLQHPDSYAELGGYTFQTATAMGGLSYMTPLRVTWGAHSAIAYKRDFGFGGGPIDGLPRVIDLWWQLAVSLGIPYEGGQWSGPVRISRPPTTGAASVLGQVPAVGGVGGAGGGVGTVSSGVADCTQLGLSGLPETSGLQARLLPDGLAAAPVGAPPAVKGMIAAGNQIAGKPYVYGGGHGLPLSEVAPSYDCSSSVEHLLYGARLLPVMYDAASGTLESFGDPGPGRWVTIYASPDHVFMYVAGMRWDTWNAAGAGDGTTGIGWHPLIRSAAGFVARHPVGL